MKYYKLTSYTERDGQRENEQCIYFETELGALSSAVGYMTYIGSQHGDDGLFKPDEVEHSWTAKFPDHIMRLVLTEENGKAKHIKFQDKNKN